MSGEHSYQLMGCQPFSLCISSEQNNCYYLAVPFVFQYLFVDITYKAVIQSFWVIFVSEFEQQLRHVIHRTILRLQQKICQLKTSFISCSSIEGHL